MHEFLFKLFLFFFLLSAFIQIVIDFLRRSEKNVSSQHKNMLIKRDEMKLDSRGWEILRELK
jgi:hypothetical protein